MPSNSSVTGSQACLLSGSMGLQGKTAGSRGQGPGAGPGQEQCARGEGQFGARAQAAARHNWQAHKGNFSCNNWAHPMFGTAQPCLVVAVLVRTAGLTHFTLLGRYGCTDKTGQPKQHTWLVCLCKIQHFQKAIASCAQGFFTALLGRRKACVLPANQSFK